MPRGKAAEKPTPKAKPPKGGAPSITDAQQQTLAINAKALYERLLEAKKKSAKAFLDGCKTIKADLGDEGVAIVKAMIELDSPEGEMAVQSRIRAQAMAQKFKGLPLGTQITMLLDEPDRTPAADRAFVEGRQASAENKPAKPPHDPSTEQYHKWMDGYNSHQASLMAGMKGKPADDGDGAETDVRPDFLRRRQAERDVTAAAASTNRTPPPANH